jgi:hypothetical protein
LLEDKNSDCRILFGSRGFGLARATVLRWKKPENIEEYGISKGVWKGLIWRLNKEENKGFEWLFMGSEQ